jgi:hypothetical protein
MFVGQGNPTERPDCLKLSDNPHLVEIRFTLERLMRDEGRQTEGQTNLSSGLLILTAQNNLQWATVFSGLSSHLTKFLYGCQTCQTCYISDTKSYSPLSHLLRRRGSGTVYICWMRFELGNFEWATCQTDHPRKSTYLFRLIHRWQPSALSLSLRHLWIIFI